MSRAIATAVFTGPLPGDLIPHIAVQSRAAELCTAETGTTLVIDSPLARVVLERGTAAMTARIEAEDRVALQTIRDYLCHILDQAAPGLGARGQWQGDFARNAVPLNFCTASVHRIWRIAPNFLRVEMNCADTERLSTSRGMHFSLLLPPAGRQPVWPRLDGQGRTVMPGGPDQLHRAVYTFVALDPRRGRFTFDVFEHDGGRTTNWARAAQPGDTVGISGPGSGEAPPGKDLLIAGDETALPAIRRILEMSPSDRRGRALIEVGSQDDICDLSHPVGMTVTWYLRSRNQSLWDGLSTAPMPGMPGGFVWIAAEKDLVRKAKARFRDDLGLEAKDGYLAYYWTAPPAHAVSLATGPSEHRKAHSAQRS
ncbi:siderophore-interacting protein [Pseudooceanicola sp. C21-150M6]|uniref:siderophore-interacting protein n=1 Tax=Pseudooceanicola sp. C21-150M6 TaxID=3434355 RepID=UPI003D7F54C6